MPRITPQQHAINAVVKNIARLEASEAKIKAELAAARRWLAELTSAAQSEA